MRWAMSEREPATRPVASDAIKAGVGLVLTVSSAGRLRSPTSKSQAARTRIPQSARAIWLLVMVAPLVEAQFDGGPESPARWEVWQVVSPGLGACAQGGAHRSRT